MKKIIGFLLVFTAIGALYAYPYFSLRPTANNSDNWIFNTPDETANYFFSQRLATTGQLTQDEQLNLVSNQFQLVHPRGTTVVKGAIAPGSFLGSLIIWGAAGKILTPAAMPFVVPLFSALAALCFFSLYRRLWGRRQAVIATFILVFLPAFWYYSSRTMFNNALFVDLLIIGLWFLANFFTTTRWRWKIWHFIAAGLLIGAALAVRSSDVLWVAAAVVLILFFQRQNLRWWHWLIMPLTILAALSPIFYWQAKIFGHPAVTGYEPEAVASGASAWLIVAQKIFLPFGFSVKNMAYNLYHYWAKMFWWPALWSVAGLIAAAVSWRQKKISRVTKAYLIISAVVFVIIVVSYGSWSFTNNLLGLPLIGSSQVRYFLPLYILAIPLMVLTIDGLIAGLKNKNAKRIAVVVVLALTFLLSLRVVWFQGPESLSSVGATVRNYYQINRQVRALTPDNAVIVSSYSDKMFFPARRVIFYWREPRFLTEIAKIVAVVPVYFYDIDQGREVEQVRSNSSLVPELVAQINNKESLYKLK